MRRWIDNTLLAAACGDDPEVKEQILSLLQGHGDADAFLV